MGLRSIIVSQGSQISPVTSTLLESVSQVISLGSSNMNIQSQPSIHSQVSIESQASIQSELSLFSQSSLGFLPSLGSLMSGGSVGEGGMSKVVDHRCVATIKGDQDGHVSSLALAGDYLYGGSSSGNNIRVWLRASLVERSRLGGGDGAVRAVVVAGDRILSAHQDHKIRIWSRTRSARRQQLEGLEGADSHKLVAAMPTFKNYLKSFIPPKNYVQIRRHHKRLWIEHVDTISMLAMGGTPTNPLLYSASWDRTIKVWRLSDFHCLESFKAHDDAINAILVSPEGLVYTASADAKIKVWNKLPTAAGQKQHSLVATLEGHKSAVNALALSREGSILYSGACDRAIIVWEREESAQHMAMAGALRGHRHAILCLATAGNVLCSGSADRTIRVWKRIDSGRMHSCVAMLQGHRGPVKCLSVAMNEALDYLVYSSSLDHDIKIWWVARCIDDEERDSTNERSAEGNPSQLISQWRHHSV